MTPFCHPFHEYPKDYRRFTLDGLKLLAGGLEPVAEGWRTGPTATLLVLGIEYTKLIFPGGFGARRRTACWGGCYFRYGISIWRSIGRSEPGASGTIAIFGCASRDDSLWGQGFCVAAGLLPGVPEGGNRLMRALLFPSTFSVSEVADAGKYHGSAQAIGGIDDILICVPIRQAE